MSGTIGTTSAFYGDSLGVAIANAANIRSRLDTLTQQVSSGEVSGTFAGLGAGSGTALTLNPALAENQTLQTTIGAALGPMQVSQTALAQISSIASTFAAQANNLNSLDPTEVDSIAASARDALVQVANLLNTTDGGTYVFAGQDSADPPIPNPTAINTSGFVTQIAAIVGGLATNGAAATEASTLAIAASNAAGTSPFSATLSQPAAAVNALLTSVSVSAGSSVPAGIIASANANIASPGTSTTGSYTRDILRALATIGALSSSQASDAGFSTLVIDTQKNLGDAITALNQDAGVLGDRQTALAATQTTLGDTNTALTAQLSNVQDVDMAATLTQLSKTQTQLQASYQMIASLQSLSLTKYLVAG
jgi:flagellar hook-associated protein 3 FlgL